jgi:predicted membrane-bound mannosyltransferase
MLSEEESTLSMPSTEDGQQPTEPQELEEETTPVAAGEPLYEYQDGEYPDAPDESDEAPPEPPQADSTLDNIRLVAPWVTIALFAVFPNYLTLALAVISIALNGGRLIYLVRQMGLEQWGYVALTGLAGVLRFWDLGLKPLHHDESMHAYFSMNLFLNPASYSYNPLLHGPFQFHAIAYVYYVASHLGSPDGGVNDVTARVAAATLGTAMIPMCYFLRERMGKAAAIVAAFLLAVSPTFVYYSRFTREDIYFVSFTFATVVALFKYCEARKLRWLLLGAGAFTFAYATKEAAFFNIAMFGGIIGGFAAWELGSRYIYPSARVQLAGVTNDEIEDAEIKGEAETDEAPARRSLPFGLDTHAGVPALLLYLVFAGVLAKVVLSKVQGLSAYVNGKDLTGLSTTQMGQVTQGRLDQVSASVQGIENALVNILLLVLILIAVAVLVVVVVQLFKNPYLESEDETAPRRGLARWFDSAKQPLLHGLGRIPWAHWFFALLVTFTIFAGLFWIVPASAASECANGVGPGYELKYTYDANSQTVGTNPTGVVCTWSQGFHQGIGDGLVQGIYYWITQQVVARGGQPWYYYFLLIPLYEQLVVAFGLVGLARCLWRPTRFRLFVVIWFVASLFLFSWAGEKMPWLALHILLPLILLAGIALDWALNVALALLDDLAARRAAGRAIRLSSVFAGRYGVAVLSLVGAFLLLIPMLHSMLYVTYVDPGEAPHEMLSYVQTTPDVTAVMAKITELDQELYHGQHQLRIGVDGNTTWPFAWYLRDYKYVWYGYNDTNPSPNDLDVLLIDPGYVGVFTGQNQQNAQQPTYKSHVYRLRAWWDEGYKPVPCVSSKTNKCDPNTLYGGVGALTWLSYGDPAPCDSITTRDSQVASELASNGVVYCLVSATATTPQQVEACTASSSSPTGVTCQPTSSFSPTKAFGNFWSWLWTRTPFGPANGSTDFAFLIRSDIPMNP